MYAARRPFGESFAGNRRLVTIADFGPRVVQLLTIVSIVSYFLISDMALTHFGFSYADVGGPFYQKLHPGTWLAFTAFAVLCLNLGHPLRALDLFCRERLFFLYVVSWFCLVVFTVFIAKRPFTPLIDTFFAPILIFVLVTEADLRTRRTLVALVHTILITNAMLGVFEYVSGWRLTPLALGSEVIEYDWRSSAFFGHPLTNAALTGSYIVALVSGGGKGLSKFALPGILCLELLAMAAFGGRSSLVISIAIVLLIGGWRLVLITRGARIDKLLTALVLTALPLLLGALMLGIESGFFDRLVGRFVDDEGSAKTRIVMLRLFDLIPMSDLIIGPDQSFVGNLQRVEGLELGIESFWVSFIMQNGIAMSGLFFIGFLLFFLQIIRVTRLTSIYPMLLFFSAISASVSLSAKTSLLSIFVAMIMIIMSPDPESQGRNILERRRVV